jgi:hypothetical protein
MCVLCAGAQFVLLVLHVLLVVLVCVHWVTAQQHTGSTHIMAKQHKATKATQATGAAPTQQVQAPTNVTVDGKPQPQVITTVKAGLKYRGARAAWYEVLCKHEGKPAAEFLAATTASPPSVPKSGVQEKSSGWLGYFVRTGVAVVK